MSAADVLEFIWQVSPGLSDRCESSLGSSVRAEFDAAIAAAKEIVTPTEILKTVRRRVNILAY